MKYYHHINKNGKGGITLGYELIEHSQGKSLAISFAQCSNKDNYCKKRGKELALKYMQESEFISLTVKGSTKNIQKRITSYLPTLAYSLNKLQANQL